MTTLSDAKLAALQTLTGTTGHVNDLEALYLSQLITGPAVSDTIQDLWDQVFTEAAIPAGQFNDRWYAYMDFILAPATQDGYNGRSQEYWDGGGTPLVPPFTPYDTLILASSPVAYYRLDETAGLVMADSSGNANDGDYTATVTLGQPLIVNDGGKSALFSGAAGSFANIKTGVMDVPTSTSPKSLECWFNTTDTVGPLMVARGPTGTPILGIYMGHDGLQVGNGQIFVLMRDNLSLGLSTLASPLTYNDGLDHHVVVTLDAAKNFILYIDGAPVHTSVHILTVGINTNDPQFGEDAITTGGAPHFSFNGRIDNGAIYDVTLNAATVLAHFNLGFVPLQPPLVNLLHWLDMSDASGVWQDTAGTIPAVDGVKFARVDNKGSDSANFLNGASTQQPVYRTAALNGKNIGDFDHGGTFRRMQAVSAAGSDPSVNGFSIAVVARLNNPQPGAAGGNELAAFSASYRLDQNNGTISGRSDVTTLFPTGAAFGDQIIHVNPYCPNQWYLFYVTSDPADVHDFAFTSPGPEIPGTVANPIFAIPAGNQFGIDMISGDAHIAEAFWWDGPLTTTERAALRAYVDSKYGVFAPGVCTYPQPPFAANLQHWWDFSDRSTLFTDTAGLNVVTSDLDTIRRVNDKGLAGDDLLDAGSSMTFHQNVVTGYPVTRSGTAQAAPRFTSQALATPPGGGTGFAQAMVNRATAVPAGNSKITQIDNGPSNISFETGFGSWAEEHQLPGFTGSNKAILINEWVEQVVTDGTTFGAHIVHVSGAADVVLPQGYLSQAGTPVEIFATQIRGEIAEMLVYDRDLSAAEVLTLSAYFDAKYATLPHL